MTEISKQRPLTRLAVEYEMRGAAAILRWYGQSVTIENLAGYLELSEAAIRKRLERDERLSQVIGLIPAQFRDPRRWTKRRM